MPGGLKAPFPWFGGKRPVARLVWSRLGDVRNYIEPFCGSAAVPLLRPHAPQIETVNDLDCMVANFWRAVARVPEQVVDACNWPVNEADLHARHRWLVYSDDAAAFRERMKTDPEYCDARIAGWWVWGLCMWIGAGWCQDGVDWKQIAQLGITGNGIHQKRPNLADGRGGAGEKGVHQRRPLKRQMPDTSNGRGVHRKVPRLTGGRRGDEYYGGLGVHTDGARPQLADAYSRGRGVHGNDSAGTCAERRAWLIEWFERLQDRLRSVRVCCGDWLRVCGSRSTTTRLGLTGVFLDPPYSKEAGRDGGLYAAEDLEVAHRVREWCKDHSGDRRMRMALCGYVGEHDELEGLGWDCVAWEARGGYGNRGEENVNKGKERIWFSPACEREATLFDGLKVGVT